MTTRPDSLLVPAVVCCGILLVLWTVPFSPSPGLQVQRSRGGAVTPREGVLLPGETVRVGELARAVHDTLYLRTEPFRHQVVVSASSRIRPEMIRMMEDPPVVSLGSIRGKGAAYVNQGTIGLRWGERSLVMRRGRVRWTRNDQRRITLGERFRGHWRVGGETRPVEVGPGPGGMQVRNGAGSGPFRVGDTLPGYDRHVSTLTRPRLVLDEVMRHQAETAGRFTLRDVFGHWVRDRWGTVYLFAEGNGEYILHSAGPDGRFFTADDRRWRSGTTDRNPRGKEK